MCARFLMQFSRIVVKKQQINCFLFFVFSASEIKFELKLVNYGKLNLCTYMFFFIKRSPHRK